MNVNPFAAVKTVTDHAADGMNSTAVSLIATTLGALACFSQTNSPAPCQWFSLPSPQLRTLTQVADSPTSVLSNETTSVRFSLHDSQSVSKSLLITETHATAAPAWEADLEISATNRLPERMTLVGPLGESDLRNYRWLDENGYLKRPPVKSDNAFVRVANNIFEPTPVRIGKTTVVCSIITAIKKKNPLCLLNPMVLSISW